MVKIPPNLEYYDGKVRIDMEEHFYRLQLKSCHGHVPDELEKQRLLLIGLPEPDRGIINEQKEEEKESDETLEMVDDNE